MDVSSLLVEVEVIHSTYCALYSELAVGEVYSFPLCLGLSKRPDKVSDLLNHIALVLWCNVNSSYRSKPEGYF